MLRFAKQAAVGLAGTKAFDRLVALADRIPDRAANLLRVLTYHRIDEPDAHPELDPSLISATPAGFRRQMDWLAHSYRVVSMEEVLEALQGRGKLPPRAVLITFDDACNDFAEHAWPILRERNLPVVLFVPTGFPDQPSRRFWWDRVHAAIVSAARERSLATPIGSLDVATPVARQRAFKRLRDRVKSLPHDEAMVFVDRVCVNGAPATANNVLGWADLRRLVDQGVIVGAHSHTHPLLNRISPEQARAEIGESIARLRAETGSGPPIFAYPSGGVNARALEILGEMRIAAAFSTNRGMNRIGRCEPLLLRRTNVSLRTTDAMVRAQLHSFARVANPLWSFLD